MVSLFADEIGRLRQWGRDECDLVFPDGAWANTYALITRADFEISTAGGDVKMCSLRAAYTVIQNHRVQ